MFDWRRDLAELINKFELYLKHLKSSGLDFIPLGNETEKFLTLINSKQFFEAPRRDLSLTEIRELIGDCRRCKLWETRTNIVFGEGNPKAELMFVGEAPGEEEDLQARPFVGRAGQLLTKMIEAMGKTRDDVYIANVVKCRPTLIHPDGRVDNRTPEVSEITACEPFLIMQIQAIKPQIICALGNVAAQTLLKTRQNISSLRGRFYNFMGIKLYPTYHPAALLRNPNLKEDSWKDLKNIMRELNWPIPKRQK